MTDQLSSRLQALVEQTRIQLQHAVHEFKDVVYSNSLGAEAMVLTDIIATHAPRSRSSRSIRAGCMTRRWHCSIASSVAISVASRSLLPIRKQIEQYVRENGINGFYLGLEERQSCCQIRKIEPFKRAIAGRKAWVTGVRREQSTERAHGEAIGWDDRYGLWKVSPMLEWKEEDVWTYIKARSLPYNPLHDKGFPSIGCAPCTRAVEPGADPRSGRWWWENPESRECGLQPRRRVIPLKVEPRRAAGQ